MNCGDSRKFSRVFTKTDIRTIVVIACASRSGSTLLDHLLSNSDQIKCVGELGNLSDNLNNENMLRFAQGYCTCGELVQQCPFWFKIMNIYKDFEKTDLSKVDTFVRKRLGTKVDFILSLVVFTVFKSFLKRKLLDRFYRDDKNTEVAGNCLKIHKYISSVTGKHIIIDSSKRPEYLYALLQARGNEERIKMIYLTRDSRAVSYSSFRRAQERNKKAVYFYSMLGWLIVNLKLINLESYFAPQDRIRVKYEDLCSNPRRVTKDICNQLRLPYDTRMGQLSKANKHNIGGSPHRFDKSTEIKLDERWKFQMDTSKKAVYYLVSFWLNKMLGYE